MSPANDCAAGLSSVSKSEPLSPFISPATLKVSASSSEICIALCAGTDVPDWVRAALPDLARTMQESSQRANRYERMILDLVEAGLLQHRVGESFAAVVVEVNEKNPTRGVVTVADPAVEAPVVSASDIPLGIDVRARLTTADVEHRKVEFTLE